MILRLIKKSNSGQSERSYARAVMEYIATPEAALMDESGHKKAIVEKCTHYAVYGCTPGLNLRYQAKEFGMIAESADCRAQHVREFQYCCPAAVPFTFCPPTATFCELAVPETV